MGATLDKPTQTDERVRARATVLLMVVALLAALFMVGAALLSSVTFQSRSLTAAEEQQTQSTVIDALSREIGTALREAAVGADGKPWNQDSTSSIGNDIGGELPGVHPLLASIEPYDTSGTGTGPWVYFAFSDLDRAVADVTAASGMTNFTRVEVDLALADYGVAGVVEDGDEAVEGGSEFDLDTNGDASDSEYYRRDADGDGVCDSYQFRLPEERYSPAIRGNLPERLRAEDNPDITADDESDLFYAIRVIPHGAMVNLSHAHETLLAQVVENTAYPELDNLAPPYAPESEESVLRRRFLLPPRELPLATLQGRPPDGTMPFSLYDPFVEVYDDFVDGDEEQRWWPIDTGQDGS